MTILFNPVGVANAFDENSAAMHATEAQNPNGANRRL